jgi:hypothetical protein
MLTLIRINSAFVGMVLIVNAIVMIVSPRGLFRLPDWLRLQEFWFEARWAGGRPSQVRVTGAFLLAVVILALYGLLVTGRY